MVVLASGSSVDILDGQRSFGPSLSPTAGQSFATDC